MPAQSTRRVYVTHRDLILLSRHFVVLSAAVLGDYMLLGTRGGYLQAVGWDGQAAACVDVRACTAPVPPQTSVSTDSPVDAATKTGVTQVCTSPELSLVAFVFSNGSAGMCEASLLRPSAPSVAPPSPLGRGVLVVRGGSRSSEHATRVAINSRYRLLAVGLENGDVAVYRLESNRRTENAAATSAASTIPFSYLRRYTIASWGFTSADVGSVGCMEWSPDGSVLAVGWTNRGLVIWSTGGTRVACTLPMLSSLPHVQTAGSTSPARGTPTRLQSSANGTPRTAATSTPTHTFRVDAPSQVPDSELLGAGVSALSWGSGGSSLLVSGHCTEVAHGFGSVGIKSRAWLDANGESLPPATPQDVPSAQSRCGCGLVTRLSLVRSSLGANPSQNESTSLALLGDDRIVLWAGKRTVHTAATADEDANEDLLAANWAAVQGSSEADQNHDIHRTSEEARRRHRRRVAHQDRFLESDGDWEHIQLPPVYLSHAWPIRLCALSTSGHQIACAGAQGLLCFNRLAPGDNKKWRRFGNVIHEQQVAAAGIAWYGEHIVCVASRGQQAAHQIHGRTSSWAPPPPASRAGQTNSPTKTDSDSDVIELLFFPRGHLDNSSLLHTHVLTHASSFHAIDISDHTLMVYLSVGQLLVYNLRAEVHPALGRQSPVSHQQSLLSKLGIGPTTAQAPIAYSTLPSAHENLSSEYELRMALELAYVVDLCAPMRPIRARQASNAEETLTSLRAMLATPPLQCRLWLASADTTAEEEGKGGRDQETPTSTPTSATSTSAPEQVYELPLFCVNVHSQGLEALHNAALTRRGSRASLHTDATLEDATDGPKSGTVLSCILLTATGTLIAVDISAAARAVAPSPSALTPMMSPSSAASSPMRAWARVVSTDVEQFWLHEMAAVDPMQLAQQYLQPGKPRSAIPTLSPSPSLSCLSKKRLRGYRLFSYGSDGMDVWFRLALGGVDSASGVPPSFESTKLLDFDPEVYPIGFDSSIGVIVGITKGLRTTSMLAAASSTTTGEENGDSPRGGGEDAPTSPFWGPVVCFRLQTKLQPYLHGVLLHLVASELGASDNEDIDDAVSQAACEYAFEIANSCRSHSYFPVSLELLLHTALNPPSYARTLRAHRDRSLRRVISFLRRFPEFPSAVVNCARKNDSSCWSRLFAHAGTPSHLFHLCLNAGQLRLASCFLIVIQRTEGMIVAREHATLVLQRIEAEEREANARIAIARSENATAAAAAQTSDHDDLSTPHSGTSSASSLSASTSSPASGPSAPSGPPSLSSSPSVSFRRRRRLSTLEAELQRFIALTHGMEEEMIAQRALAVAEAAARGEAERRRREAQAMHDSNAAPVGPAQSTPASLGRVDAAAWSNPTAAVTHTQGSDPTPPHLLANPTSQPPPPVDEGAGCSVM